MSFVNTQHAPYIIFFIIVFCLTLFIMNKRYFSWIKTYWSYKRTMPSYISSALYALSISLMLLSLLDLRGPEKRIKSTFPDQRTIIIIDSSTSMLAEDVRPSRFSKAIQMARHLVKNAAAHQVSIVLFSDVQKRLIPFTDDIDLLDSRLAALEKTNSVSGGSNISQAVAEAIGYFDFEDNKDQAVGNIVVFTDAEESEGEFDLDIGPNVNLAVVGIGTVNGSNIPLRWEDGTFRGYKSQKGQPVITKLDENYIKKLGKKVKNYKYWIANSYSLPTDEILNFFRSSYNKKQSKGDVRVRPVYSYLILIPAIILYCLSIVIGRLKTFKALYSIFFLISIVPISYANESNRNNEKKIKEIPKKIQADLEKMKAGKYSRREVLKIAEKFLKNDDPDRAMEIYKEYSKEEDDESIMFNRTTAQLKAGKIEEAMPDIQNLFSNSKNENLKNKLRNNVLLALNSKSGGQGKDKKQENNENKDKDNKEKNKEEGKEGDKGNSKEENKEESKEDNKENKKEDNKNQDKKPGKSGNPDDKKSDQEKSNESENEKENELKKDPKDLERPERPEEGPRSREEKEKKIEQQRKLVKTPAMIKQILSDDRELQKKMMDTSTSERSSQKPKRDW